MLYLFSGSDRRAAREALGKALAKAATRDAQIVHITDAHAPDDLHAALAGPGMFSPAGGRVVELDGTFANEEMRDALLAALPALKASSESFFILEGALDVATRKRIEKYAETSERFDAKKPPEDKTVFALANALQKGDKKALWVGLMREYAKGSAPEAVHGLLFWGAKQMLVRNSESERARFLVARLAELPHESRRAGEDLGYALERFALTRV